MVSVSIDTTVVDRVSYLKIKYLDLWGEGNIGSPELPVHYLRFSVPYNAVDFTVTITEQNTVTEHYTLPVPEILGNIGYCCIQHYLEKQTGYRRSQSVVLAERDKQVMCNVL